VKKKGREHEMEEEETGKREGDLSVALARINR
jgi:hypothetical protein